MTSNFITWIHSLFTSHPHYLWTVDDSLDWLLQLTSSCFEFHRQCRPSTSHSRTEPSWLHFCRRKCKNIFEQRRFLKRLLKLEKSSTLLFVSAPPIARSDWILITEMTSNLNSPNHRSKLPNFCFKLFNSEMRINCDLILICYQSTG